MRIRKTRLYAGLAGALALMASDLPRRAVPVFWRSGLQAAGNSQFLIRREGDVTLKYVTASLTAENLDIVPVPYYRGRGPAVESVQEIARRFGRETRSKVIAAINGGFFDTSTGLPIGFLLRDRRMEFFNMPQGFTRSMVGFSPFGEGGWSRVHISSPQKMPKVWLDTLFKRGGSPFRMMKVPLHHINVPGGKNALGLFTPLFGQTLRIPPKAIYVAAIPVTGRPGVYQVATTAKEGIVTIPQEGIVIAFHGDSRAQAGAFPKGAIVRPGWSLPADWSQRDVSHGLLAGPRLLEKGSIQVTARQERLDQLKSRDRVALGVKANGETVLLWAHKNTAGNLSFEQVAQILARMGAHDAIALDGGRSRAIFAQSGDAPADKRYFEGGRPVSNALVLSVRPGHSS